MSETYSYFFPKNLVWGNYDIDGNGHIDEMGNPILISNVLNNTFANNPPTVVHIESGINVIFSYQLGGADLDILYGTLRDYQQYFPSKIENIHRNWQNLYRDYKQARAALQGLITDIGWDGLSTVERKIMSMWFVAPIQQRITVHTIPEQVAFAKTFHDNSVIARGKRADAATSAMYNYLSKSDAFELVDDIVNNYNLIGKYITYGREGTLEDGIDGLFDYLLSREGSIFSGCGLLNKSFVPHGITLPQLVDAAMDIFKNGNYK